MKVPVQTVDIFKVLSRGQFISSNSSDRSLSQLFEVLDDEHNFEILHEYFRNIEFILEKGDGYYYFSRPETKTDLERKLVKAFEWIDVLDFFKTYDHSFGVGYRFSPADILVKIKTDAELEMKLENLNKYVGKANHQDILERILKKLSDESFIELENEITHQYKVLAAFKYLEQLILTIHIPEDVINEIPE